MNLVTGWTGRNSAYAYFVYDGNESTVKESPCSEISRPPRARIIMIVRSEIPFRSSSKADCKTYGLRAG